MIYIKKLKAKGREAIKQLILYFMIVFVFANVASAKLSQKARSHYRAWEQELAWPNPAKAVKIADKLLPLIKQDTEFNKNLYLKVLEGTAPAANALGLNSKAYDYYSKAYDIRKSRFGENDNKTMETLHEVGMMHAKLRESEEALKVLKQVQKNIDTSKRKEDEFTLRNKVSIAIVLRDLGLLSESEKMFFKAKDEGEKSNNVDGRAIVYFQMGLFYHIRSNYDEAFKFLEKALYYFQKNPRRNAGKIIGTLQTLGRVFRGKGLYAEALAWHNKTLQFERNLLPPNHPHIINTISHIIGVYADLGEYPQAIKELKKIIQFKSRHMAPNDPALGVYWNNLGYLQSYNGDYDDAYSSFQKSLKILKPKMGKKHPIYGNTLLNLSVLEYFRKNNSEAISNLSTANSIYENALEVTGTAGLVKDRITFIRSLKGKTDWTIWMGVNGLPDSQAAQDLALLSVLRRKGYVFDTSMDYSGAMQSKLSKSDQKMYQEMVSLKGLLSSALFGQPKGFKYISDIKTKINAIERKLVHKNSNRQRALKDITIEKVQNGIPPNALLIEYILYRPFDPKVPKAHRYSIPEHFALCTLSKNHRTPWIDLGPSKEIVKTIVEQRNLLMHNDLQSLDKVSKKLYDLILKPIEKEFKGKELLLISPDSILNLVSFPSLKNSKNKYLIEVHEIGFLGSGRDLLSSTKQPSKSIKDIVLVGGINFNNVSRSKTKKKNISLKSKDCKKVAFSPLPGTKAELKSLKKIMPSAKILYGSKASEKLVKNIKSPKVFHLATHGFFMPDQSFDIIHVPTKRGNDICYIIPPIPENPLLRSGLALSGANNPLNSDDDGILTALEVSSMNLADTELVVLSACDTGLGDVLPGEGVFGLIRGFQLAGAKSVVMTLWPASDIATPILMKNYYRSLLKGSTRTGALRAAQTSMLKGQYKHPRNWATFTHCGQWNPLLVKTK